MEPTTRRELRRLARAEMIELAKTTDVIPQVVPYVPPAETRRPWARHGKFRSSAPKAGYHARPDELLPPDEDLIREQEAIERAEQTSERAPWD
jgi:hypothetical protein